MAAKRGISILDLIGYAPPGAQNLLPDEVAGFLEQLAVLDHHSMTSGTAFVHFGTVQAGDIALPRVTGSSKPVEAPDLTRGVYFRLFFPRASRGPGQNVEPPPSAFVLDLILDPVAMEFESLVPARFAPAAGVTPAHLEPANEVRRPGDKPRKTRLYARGALRVSVDSSGITDVGIVDFPDPFDVALSAGPVFDAWFEPPHFFLRSVGLTVGDIIVDFSTKVTPPEVTARGQPAEWQGIAIQEATVYLPRRIPKLGIVNFGVRDLLLGHPFGLQGEAFVELGQDPATAIHPTGGPLRIITDDPAGPGQPLVVAADPLDPNGRLFKVTLPGDTSVRVRAQLDSPPPDTVARWRLPGVQLDAPRATGFFTPVFSAGPGDELQLELTRVDTVDGQTQAVTFGTRSFFFVSAATAPGTGGPKINVEAPGNSTAFQNVLSVSGDTKALEGVKFLADPPGTGLKWEGELGNEIVAGPTHTLTGLNPRVFIGIAYLTLRDADKHTRRVLVHVLEKGDLVIGCQAGVFDAHGTPLKVKSLKQEYDLATFHKDARAIHTTGGTTLSGDAVVVPPGVFAEVTLKRTPGIDGEDDEDAAGGGTGATTPGARTAERVQVLVDYDKPASGEPLSAANPRWGDKRIQRSVSATSDDTYMVAEGSLTAPLDDGQLEALLGAWAVSRLAEHMLQAAPDPAQFLVVGRCDDIHDNTDDHNKALADSRAAAVEKILTAALKDQPGYTAGVTVLSRGEQSSATAVETLQDVRDALYSADEAILGLPNLPMRPGATSLATLKAESPPAPARLIRKFFKIPQQDQKYAGTMPRPNYRRIDIVAFTVQAPDANEPLDSTNANEQGQDPELGRRRIWVPGVDAPETTKIKPSQPSYPMLVQADIAWDSPSVSEVGDLVPTKAEVAVTWVHRGVKVPGTTDPVPATKGCDEDPTVPEFYKLKARFAHDQRTGETVYTIALDSIGDPKGLACLSSDPLAAVAALAPSLLPLLDQSGFDDDGARIAALITVLGLGALAVDNGRLVIEGIQAELRSRGYLQLEGSRLRLGVDYAVEADLDLLLIKGTKLRIRYKNVGVLIALDALAAPSSLDLDDLRFVFDEASVEVQQPGEWRIQNETLGKLLRVTAARLGTGSAWIEVDMGMAVDLGVITITQATIRATLTDGSWSPSLRGLEVQLDVPKTVRGKGKLSLNSTGELSAAIELEIIPARISAAASLRMVGDFFSLFVETKFATPIPLAGTGLGVFGFNGHLVVNGARALPAGDVVQRELSWYAQEPASRYQPKPGSWAVGIGAVIGTLPDQAFSYNATGLLAIELPDLSVVFGIDSKFLDKPDPATAKGKPVPDQPEDELRLLGLVAITPDAVTVGVRGLYKYKKLLKVDVPIGGYFPIESPDPWFVRVGSDGFVGDPPGTNARPGSPIKVTVLPDSLEVEATAFLMIEEKGIINLGNRSGFDFPGFAIGAGLRFELDWGNDFIGIKAAAEILLGVGFSPLTVGAGLFVDGEVYFLLLSAGFEGELFFRYVDHPGADLLTASGRVCAKVGFWKWKHTKCKQLTIGDDLFEPVPPSPLAGVELINRLDRVIGGAGGDPAGGVTVWPDAIPVVHFAHPVQVELAPGSAFDPGEVDGPTWVGSKDLQYAYRLTGVEIRPVGGAPLAGPLPCTWSFPSHRGMFPAAGDPPTGDERRDLHLLSNHPLRWTFNLLDGGLGILADPAASLDRACEPTPPPSRICVFGERAVRMGIDLVRLTPRGPSPGPFPSWFVLNVRETIGPVDLGRAAVELANLGFQVVLGQVAPLPQPLPPAAVTGDAVAMYDSARVEQAGRLIVTVPMDARFAPEVVEPELLVALCSAVVQEVPGQRCDVFDDLPSTFSGPKLGHNGLAYQAVQGAAVGVLAAATVGRQRALRFTDAGVDAVLPEAATEVSVTVFQARNPSDDVEPASNLTLRCLSASGQVVATVRDHRTIVDENRVIVGRDPSGQGITRVVLSGGFGRAHLVKLCYRHGIDPKVQTVVDEAVSSGGVPRVTGTRSDGVQEGWVPTVVFQQPSCTLVLYRPRGEGQHWSKVRVGAWARSRVGIVRCCAVTVDAQEQHDEAEENRQDFVNGWNTPPTPPRFLLEADTGYEVRVTYQAVTWARPADNGVPSKTETAPPATPSFGGSTVESFFFRTARAVPQLPPDAPIDTENESMFDPRQARRYVARLLPDHLSPPHFTGDPASLAYTVGHVETLMQRYGRQLAVSVRRTDPATGSQPPAATPPPPTPPHTVHDIEFPIELLAAADLHLIEAAEATSCLDPRPPEGSAGELFFDLEPDADYDLLITAAPTGNPAAAEDVVHRTQFHTSHYASPRELLDGLGFTTPAPDPSLPVEILVDAALPGTQELGDAPFDATMVELGLDPLPLISRPRVALLLQLGTELELAGVLLEAPEPLHRDGRLSVDQVQIILGDGAIVPLAIVRRNAAGTRVLLAPPAPIPVGEGTAMMECTLMGSREGPIAGSRYATAGRLRLAGELVS